MKPDRQLLKKVYKKEKLILAFIQAVQELNLKWKAGKDYHFPEGAYVEYSGSTSGEDISVLVKEIENKSNKIVFRKIDTRILFSEKSAQYGKPLRTVYYGVLCGGTHVANPSDIVSVTIRKIKQDKDKIKVSYA